MSLIFILHSQGDHLLPKKSTTYPKLTPCVAASCTKQCQVSTKSHKKSTRPPEYDNSTEDSSPQAGKTKVKRVANKSIKNRSNKETKTFSESQASLFNNYQTLYGPSSLKSSTDCGNKFVGHELFNLWLDPVLI